LRDKPEGRWIQLENGKIRTGKGLHAKPDVTLFFKNAAIAESFLTPPFDMLERIDAAKNFKIGLEARTTWPSGSCRPWRARDGDLEIRHRHGQWRHALHQRHQQRPDLRLREGRQDPAHHADRLRRGTTRRPGRSPRAARPSSPRAAPPPPRTPCA
jgi:hypothetical protein